MTVEELREVLLEQHPRTELHVCHFAKRAGKNIPIIRPLAELRWINSHLVLVEQDDRNLYLASV